eukprot:scaffold14.g1155.t1
MEDVYEAEDESAEEERHAERFDRVDNYEYEMPLDFEDEEIDEDAAFNDEDEKLYGHLFGDMKGSSGSEGSEGEEDEADLLDSEEEEKGEEGEGWSEEEEDVQDELAMFGEGEESPEAGGSSYEGEEGEEDGTAAAGSDEEAEEEARHAAMLAAVTGGGAAGRRRRRQEEEVQTEAYPESEYNLPAAADGELTVADLIAGLGDGKAKLGAARKVLERMEKKAAPVAAPLPGPIRARQERRAGYDEAKKEVAKHEPETVMEAEVAALLEAAGAHTGRAVAEAEEALAMKARAAGWDGQALSVEEARERQNRLAKMRALLFYHEAKAKRMKKIKSKEYRRKLKKAEQRRGAGGGAEGEEDGEGEEIIRLREEAEFERAKERLTLKHKNTSRWVRRALKRGSTILDEGTKAAVAEQLRLGQELRQRVNSLKPARGSDDSDDGGSTSASDEDVSDAEGEGVGGSFAGDKAGRGLSTRAKAAALELLQAGGGGEEGELPSKGLFSLPFMRRALDKKRAQVQEEARALLQELEGGEQASGAGAGVFGGGGRLAFAGDGGKQQRAWERVEAMEADSDWDSDADEDAEAKAERLGKQLAAGEDGRQQRRQGRRGKAGAGEDGEPRAAGGGAAVHPPTPGALQQALAAVAGGGSSDEGGPGGEQRQQEQQAASLPHHAHLFGATDGAAAAANGSVRRAKRQRQQAAADGGGGVSVGPAAAGGARQQAPVQQEDQQRQPRFVKSRSFQGARPGYAFKRGKEGVGYYLDRAEGERAARAAAKAAKAAQAAAAQQQQHQQLAAEPPPHQQRREQARGKEGKAAAAGEAAPEAPRRPATLPDGGAGADAAAGEHMQPVAGGGAGALLGLSQEELIRRAFAGDDVQAEFTAEKTAEVEGELPQVGGAPEGGRGGEPCSKEAGLPPGRLVRMEREDVPGVLPGWGTWAGQQREPAWAAQARRKAEQRKAAAAAGRADAKLQYVVISEKWDKKSSKFKTPAVPYPFDSRETYERAMRQPLGREYNTDAAFRNFTRPAILKDAGVIIEPIRFSKAVAEYDDAPAKASKRPAVVTVAGGMPKRAKKVR